MFGGSAGKNKRSIDSVSGSGESSSGEGRLDKKRDQTTRYLGPLRFLPVVESGQECWFVVIHWSFALDLGKTTISFRSIVRRHLAIELANNYALCAIQESLMNWQAFVWITVYMPSASGPNHARAPVLQAFARQPLPLGLSPQSSNLVLLKDTI